jgi:twitching motility protein PilT
VESPIEFLHRDLNSSVTQREVGVDTENLASGLQASLRQDPDVVVVQELLDHEMVDAALTAAETGRLVISSFHTPDATSTVSRLVALFGHEEREVARIRIADALAGVISQRLLATTDGGRCVAAEIATGTPEIRAVIRDRQRAGEMYDLIADSRERHGMQTIDQHLVDLVSEQVVEYDLAVAAATNEAEFRRMDAVQREAVEEDASSSERRTGKRTRRHGPRDRRRRKTES